MEVVAVIPARLLSSRLPEKALVDIGGEPMIIRVVEKVQATPGLADVVVATDSQKIYDVVTAFGAKAVMTGEHQSGSDRVAEAVKEIKADYILNVQGDEPLIEPEMLDGLIGLAKKKPEFDVVTAASPFRHWKDVEDPSNVKAVISEDGRALYFSRNVIPNPTDMIKPDPRLWLHHQGVYLYKAGYLQAMTNLDSSFLEKTERLEQLRVLETGGSIGVLVWPNPAFGVDTPDDLEKVRAIFAGEDGE